MNEAIAASRVKPEHCIIFQRRAVHEAELIPGLDLDWDDVVAEAEPHPCVPVESNWPLYILYTSGTTGAPSRRKRQKIPRDRPTLASPPAS